MFLLAALLLLRPLTERTRMTALTYIFYPFLLFHPPLFLTEKSCIQEDPAGPDLSNIQHHAAQLWSMDRHCPDLLLRVWGSPLGDRTPGGTMLPSAESNVTRSARISSTPTAFSVSLKSALYDHFDNYFCICNGHFHTRVGLSWHSIYIHSYIPKWQLASGGGGGGGVKVYLYPTFFSSRFERYTFQYSIAPTLTVKCYI